MLTSIGLLLSEPNPDDGLMCEAVSGYAHKLVGALVLVTEACLIWCMFGLMCRVESTNITDKLLTKKLDQWLRNMPRLVLVGMPVAVKAIKFTQKQPRY